MSKDEPLSVDLKIFPEAPTTTNTPEPEEEVVVSSVVVVSSSVVVVVVPEELELLLDSSFLAQEVRMRLKMDMRIMYKYKTFFIFSLHQ